MKRFYLILLVIGSGGIFGCAPSGPDSAPPRPNETSRPAPDDEPNPADGAAAPDDSGSQSDGAEITDHDDASATPVDQDTQQLRRMASPDPHVLASAVEYFETAYDDDGVSVFFEHLRDPDAVVRRGAMYGIYSHFDPAQQRMLRAARSALDDGDPVVRRLGLKTMALRAFPREEFLEAIPRIAEHLDDEHEPDPHTRAQVARMLAKYQTAAQPALPALNEAVKSDPQYQVRTAALHAIYDIARNAEEALPAPTYVLTHDPDPRLRRVAAKRLGSYGAASAPAVDELIAALSDDAVPQRPPGDPLHGADEPVCLAAADALTKIGEPAVEPLLAALGSEDRRVRLLSIRALGDMGPSAKEAIAPLQRLAESEDSGAATAAKAALVRIQKGRRP